ncbi:helix-turn-helix domain-containing protein [Streptomyces sp. NPDC021354]|uniref:helix-turn-helix domain-containing protein n=1 Tax=Streptomyces sp. NPDC021354 TaxID=3154793 RepID=UPI00340ADFB4
MDGTIPLPHDVKDSTQFVAEMRRLRQWADLSYRELERRAGSVGDVLPRATLAGALNRQELPREELVAAFVRACGGDKAAVEAWVGARKRLAVELGQEQEQDSSEPVEPEGEDAPESSVVPATEPVAETPDPDPDQVPKEPKRPKRKRLKAAGRRLRRPGVVITATAAIVILTAAATAILHPGDKPDKPRESSRTEAPAATTPSSTKSRPADDATTDAADAEPVSDEPSRGATRETSSPTPSQQTTTPKKTKPTRSSPTPEWTYDPPAVPDDPPPSTDTPPPSGGGDPFPEETCWDVTEEC